MVSGAPDNGLGPRHESALSAVPSNDPTRAILSRRKCPLWKSYSYIENIAFQYQRLLEAPAESIRRKTLYLADYEPIDLLAWCDAFQRAFGSRPIPHVPLAVARTFAYCGDAVNAIGVRNFPFNSFRLNNVLTQYRFDTKATEAVCGPLPYSMEQGVAETAAWLRGLHGALTCSGPGASGFGPPRCGASLRLPRSIIIPSTTIDINTIAEFAMPRGP